MSGSTLRAIRFFYSGIAFSVTMYSTSRCTVSPGFKNPHQPFSPELGTVRAHFQILKPGHPSYFKANRLLPEPVELYDVLNQIQHGGSRAINRFPPLDRQLYDVGFLARQIANWERQQTLQVMCGQAHV